MNPDQSGPETRLRSNKDKVLSAKSREGLECPAPGGLLVRTGMVWLMFQLAHAASSELRSTLLAIVCKAKAQPLASHTTWVSRAD